MYSFQSDFKDVFYNGDDSSMRRMFNTVFKYFRKEHSADESWRLVDKLVQDVKEGGKEKYFYRRRKFWRAIKS